jgi:hypothetical protein
MFQIQMSILGLLFLNLWISNLFRSRASRDRFSDFGFFDASTLFGYGLAGFGKRAHFPPGRFSVSPRRFSRHSATPMRRLFFGPLFEPFLV